MKITIASYITLVRIALAPFVVHAIVQQQWGQVLLLFLLAMMTDYLDGFVARRYSQESKLGQLLDPIADKVLIVSALYALLHSISDGVAQYAILFLILKECVLVSGAAVLHYKYNVFIKPSRLSRAASVAEMILVVILASMLYAHYVMPTMILHTLVLAVCGLSVALLIRYSIFIWRLNHS